MDDAKSVVYIVYDTNFGDGVLGVYSDPEMAKRCYDVSTGCYIADFTVDSGPFYPDGLLYFILDIYTPTGAQNVYKTNPYDNVNPLECKWSMTKYVFTARLWAEDESHAARLVLKMIEMGMIPPSDCEVIDGGTIDMTGVEI